MIGFQNYSYFRRLNTMKNYKIYINESSLLITDLASAPTMEITQLDTKGFNFLTFYNGLNCALGKTYVLVTSDAKALFKKIKKDLVLIKAAGGLVRNAEGKYLFIFRNKRWDLPKGKVEKGEKMKDAGLREVEEECGVTIANNNERLCRTYHIYELGSKIVLKKTNWYDMTVKGVPKLIPQKEEGITKAEWLGADELGKVLENTYPLILEVLSAGAIL